MEFNKKNTDILQEKVYRNENLIASKNTENLSYLYPNGHRITHQMRWFKFSRESLRTDISA